MKGALYTAIAVLVLPGSVIMLLAANFGVLKGYLLGATAFFGFVFLLSLIWIFGLPGTPSLTGPKGADPSFKEFTLDSPQAAKYGSVRQFQGGEGNGWQPQPELPEGGELSPDQETLRADLETASQAVVQKLITDTNKDVEDSSKELDVTNLDPKVFYAHDAGTTVAAVVVSPKDPPAGSGLERPTFAPKTFFAFRDPGSPFLPSWIMLGGSFVLFVGHLLAIGAVERRRPLGQVTAGAQVRTPTRV